MRKYFRIRDRLSTDERSFYLNLSRVCSPPSNNVKLRGVARRVVMRTQRGSFFPLCFASLFIFVHVWTVMLRLVSFHLTTHDRLTAKRGPRRDW
eukprot:scaffold13528_cov169-Amphora_coffeaeformis.AAC.4